MAIEFRSETAVTSNGATVEIGTVTFQGKDFAATGAILDEAHGYIQAYVTELDAGNGWKRYVLTTWEGKEISAVQCVRRWEQYVFGSRVTFWAWRATVNGKKYHGRNSGPAMSVKLVCRALGSVRMRAKSE